MTARLGASLATLSIAVLAGCGGDDGADRPPAAAGDERCGRVTVPGHEAVGIRASGAECAIARRVAAAAEGRGRQPYQSDGFACEPAEAAGGDTDYTCSRDGARISFRYGTG